MYVWGDLLVVVRKVVTQGVFFLGGGVKVLCAHIVVNDCVCLWVDIISYPLWVSADIQLYNCECHEFQG